MPLEIDCYQSIHRFAMLQKKQKKKKKKESKYKKKSDIKDDLFAFSRCHP